MGKIPSGASYYFKDIAVDVLDMSIPISATADGSIFCGGIAGLDDANASDNSTLVNSRVYQLSVTKNGKGTAWCGGLFGRTSTPLVGNLSQEFKYRAIDNVDGVNMVGGLVGSTSSTVSKSAAIDQDIVVTNTGSNNMVGGLVGNASSASIAISNSYATGTIDSYSNVGGAIGGAPSATSGNILTNVYLDLRVTDAGVASQNRKYVVGLLPGGSTAAAVSTYYSTTIQDTPYSGAAVSGITGASPKVAADFLDQNTFVDWDFESTPSIWYYRYEDSPPRLRLIDELIVNAG